MANQNQTALQRLATKVSRFLGAQIEPTEDLGKDMRSNSKKRISYQLKRYRQFLVDLDQDVLRMAIMEAEEPDCPRRQNLYAIYKEVLRDIHLRSQIRTAIYKVISEPWVIVNKKTKEMNKELTELLQKQWFEDLSKHILMAEYWGHSLIEFGIMEPGEPEYKSLAPLVFKKVKLIPREHVRPETGELLLHPSSMTGIPYREEPYNDWFLEAGDPEDLGLLHIAAKNSIYKKYNVGDWARSAEKWSDPLLIIRSASDNDEENDKKEEFAANFGNNGYALFDDDDEVELLERSNGQGYKIHEDFCNYLDKENSKGVNGQTGTSDEKSFVGAADVHERILDDYTEARTRGIFYFHNDHTIPFLIGKGYKLEGHAWIPLRFVNQANAGKNDPDPKPDPNKPDPKNPGNGGSGGNPPGKKP